MLTGVYRSVCLEVLVDRVRVQVPQLYADRTVTIFECAGTRPVAGALGWVAFESGQAERPVWVGSESLDLTTPIADDVVQLEDDLSALTNTVDVYNTARVAADVALAAADTALAAADTALDARLDVLEAAPPAPIIVFAPYFAKEFEINLNSSTGGQIDVHLTTMAITVAGWMEVIVSGGYAGFSTGVPGSTTQGVYTNGVAAPTGAGWTVRGAAINMSASATWFEVPSCSLVVPIGVGGDPDINWRGAWGNGATNCYWRSKVSVKFYDNAGVSIPVP